jgi:hypothetical protein
MPLLDHFHPPLSTWRPWHSVHHAWCTKISDDLNSRLPKGYVAMPNVQYNIEIDVAAFEGDRQTASAELLQSGSTTAVACPPPMTFQSLRFPLVTDVVESLIYIEEDGLTLAAAIELVSPANKDRPDHRQVFVSKCETYLQQGAGVMIVDIVTRLRANLHDDLIERLDDPAARHIKEPLYVASYHPVTRRDDSRLDIWQQPLQIKQPLPKIPLWLKGGLCLTIDLEETYQQTCRGLRIDIASN